MSDADEVVLWDSYDRLSKLVAPATDESLEIADQIRQARAADADHADTWPMVARGRRELRKIVVFLITMVAIFLVTQAYVLALTMCSRTTSPCARSIARSSHRSRPCSPPTPISRPRPPRSSRSSTATPSWRAR